VTVLRGVAAVTVAVLAACAGVGWLYLGRGTGALAAGPAVGGVLPLEHLARADAQPLLRVLVIWTAVGGAAGLALAVLRVRHAALVCGLGVLVVLGLTGALSDAVQENQAMGPHLAPQLARGATWLAAAIVGASAALARWGAT
jgi:hypothetical protein